MIGRVREGEDAREPLGSDELRTRAVTGAVVLGGRAVLIYILGIGANLALARLLVPRDFGVVALGTVLLVVGGYFAEAGFGGALIQREQPPTRVELEAVYGLQLAITVTLAAGCAAVAIPFGHDGLVVAAMVASLPLTIVRMPAMIVLERSLQYRVVALADVLEALSYYLWAIGTVALGLGVWGLATAVTIRAIAGSTTVTIAGPLGLVRPRWSWSHVRPMLGFGVKYQLTGLLQVIREQGLNVGVAAVAGVATLGVWNLASRVLQIPILLFVTVNRVVFPSMSRMLGAGEDPRPTIETGLGVLAVLTGAVTVALAAFAPSLPIIVGGNWSGVPTVLFWSAIAMVISAPITVATGGYLFAAGKAGTVAVATVLSALVWFGIAFPLLATEGAKAVGLGWIASGAVYVAILGRATARLSGASIVRRLAGPTLVGLGATAAAWLVANQMPDTFGGAGLGLAAGGAVLLAGFAAVSRRALEQTRRVLALALRSFATPPPATAPADAP
jgi:O-antigen/teichoic acid export membrane protein